MKIYEIGTGYTPIPAQMGAATEIVVEELTRSLLKKGKDVRIIDIASNNRAKTDLPIIEVNVPDKFSGTDVALGIMHKFKRVVYSIALAKKIKEILKTENDKVVFHFHNQYNLYFVSKLVPKNLLKKAVIAYTVHSYIWSSPWHKIENIVKKKYFQEIYCVKNADVVFVLNDITADHFINKLGVNRKKIHQIKNGVNKEKYCPIEKSAIEDLKSKNNLTGKKVIFQVGSVCERKNQLQSLEMLCEYLKGHSDVVFMYAGGIIESEYQQAIVDFAKNNGISDQVKYIGEVAPGEVLNTYYNIADCCVFTSTMEALSLVIIEAIYSGTPVVLRWNLKLELKGGYSIYTTQKEFIASVDKALSSEKTPRSEIAEILNKYSWDSVANEITSVFSKNK